MVAATAIPVNLGLAGASRAQRRHAKARAEAQRKAAEDAAAAKATMEAEDAEGGSTADKTRAKEVTEQLLLLGRELQLFRGPPSTPVW